MSRWTEPSKKSIKEIIIEASKMIQRRGGPVTGFISVAVSEDARKLFESWGYNSMLVDVVPYITSVTRNGDYVTNRTRSGAVPLLRDEETNRIEGFNLGTEISKEEMKKSLDSLDLKTTIEGEMLVITIPTFRIDIAIKEDIAEEIARIYGYDKIPTTIFKVSTEREPKSKNELLSDKEEFGKWLERGKWIANRSSISSRNANLLSI